MASSAPRLLSFPLLDGVAPDGRLAWADGDKSIREVGA